MKRVVVTGIGIVSCLGNNQSEVYSSLLNTKSGIGFSEEYQKYNFKSQICGIPKIKVEDYIDRKIIRFMGEGSAYNYIAMKEAVTDSGLEEKDVSNETTGIIMGSGGPSIKNVVHAVDSTREVGPKKMGPFVVPRTMASTVSATLAVPFKIKGVNESLINDVNEIQTRTKLKDRLILIEESGGKLIYVGAEKETMEYNLKVSDSHMPKIIGYVLLSFYKERISKITDIVDFIHEEGELNKEIKYGEKKILEIKIKRQIFKFDVNFIMTEKKFINNWIL